MSLAAMGEGEGGGGGGGVVVGNGAGVRALAPANVARARFLDSHTRLSLCLCTPLFPSPQKPTLLNSKSI